MLSVSDVVEKLKQNKKTDDEVATSSLSGSSSLFFQNPIAHAPLASLESSIIEDNCKTGGVFGTSVEKLVQEEFLSDSRSLNDLNKNESFTNATRLTRFRKTITPESLQKSDEMAPNGRVSQTSMVYDQSSPNASHVQVSTSESESVDKQHDKWGKLRSVMHTSHAINHSKLKREDSFLKKFSVQRGARNDCQEEDSNQDAKSEKLRKAKAQEFVINPQGNCVLIWLGIVTIAVLHNLWTCIAREAFPEIRVGYDILWLTLDGIMDLIYLLDILVQLRTSYLERGLSVNDNRKLARRYVRSRYFVLDLLSILPLDFLQFVTGIHPMLRFPRFIKVYRWWKWKIIVENRTIYPNAWRVANLTHILLIACHWFAAFYYMISQAENFEGAWGYPKPEGEFASITRKYLKSLYWATLTLTTIGDLPQPQKNWEEYQSSISNIGYVFTIVSYLIGVFCFATIVGQIGNVITNRNATRLEFEKILDNAKNFMRVHNVHQELQRRVLRWYDYAWSRGRTNGGGDINSLGLLPDKLKTELAIHVNLATLKRVAIFRDCRPEFLHDLVLKMRPYIFTPGDLICRKGEVAREMFIIADGLLEVISDTGEVLSKMSSGDFFGEIGILNLDGGINRRTADVKSIGYSELFVLSKEDVLAALKDHPDAEQYITKYARYRLKNLESRTHHHHESFLRIPTHRLSTDFMNTFSNNAESDLPSECLPNLLKCVSDIVKLKTMDMELYFQNKIKELEKENEEKLEYIRKLESNIDNSKIQQIRASLTVSSQKSSLKDKGKVEDLSTYL